MKIGVFTVLLADKPFEAALDYLVDLGVEAIELGTGAYPGNAHCDPAALLRSSQKRQQFRAAIRRRGLIISALSCHGNPLHPQAKIARAHHDEFVRTVEARQGLKVGCPEEVAYQMGFIDREAVRALGKALEKTGYGQYLLDLADTGRGTPGSK